ncbi:TIGR03862 family flavoprotein [Pelagimonas varians]|uniref:Putative glutamate synthase (NADPH) small subunit n=1 Tax=Pelagimonas varians TaxID=696760 RepID=A0A238KQX9_9RHOB|nr:TIGR03862 family flavoprotein [Pelagimonas varians]PYG28547.1 hypothetical protein C8N36_11145 [Pelagimonas varians]SMX45128.1 putative glutamate synthase (NADPH) small subunit [Pelagimonas varians]
MSQTLVIGGGPAGLMAAEMLLDAGHGVILADAKPSLGRKMLMAGKSGLNLTKVEPLETFIEAYRDDAARLRPMLRDFGPGQVRQWAQDLAQDTFVGSSGRLYPTAMKASPLLRAWLARLIAKGLDIRTRCRWTGWDHNGAACFETPKGPLALTADATVLALGGASWARLGSDGKWADQMAQGNVAVTPFAASNVGVVVSWSDHMRRFFGSPIKNACFSAGDQTQRGEVILSARGIEGGGIYPLSPSLRDGAALHIDLMPDLSHDALITRLKKTRGKQSLSNHLRKALRLPAQVMALLNEVQRPLPSDSAKLAQLLKAVPVPYTGLRPMDEAISTAGGVAFSGLTSDLMIKNRPGVFCAGEMLEWDAPTGGYLITACLSTGRWAGLHAADYLDGPISS